MERSDGVVGREAELCALEGVLGRGSSGPVGIVIEGAPGMGKTTMWRAAVGLARERGFDVIAAAPGEPDASLAFAGLGDLFDGVSGELAGLPAPQRSALAAALSLENSAVASGDQLALPRAVLAVLRRLAERAPLVVAIDDEQWLDLPSARALGFALCRVRAERVCVVLSRRTDTDGALLAQLEGGFAAGGLERLAVGPLGVEALEAVLCAGLGRVLPRPVVRRVHAVSGGNPLYALAIAREVGAGVSGVGELPVPRTLAEAMRRRLAGVDGRAGDTMLAVAALSHPTLALLAGALPGFVLGDLDSAVAAGVVEIAGERVGFTHPLLASTCYTEAPAARRRELHRVLAGVLEDEVDRARHLALGAEAPDRLVALTLEQAAEVAARRGAPEIAGLLLQDAVRLTPLELVELRRLRAIAAAERHWASGNVPLARELLESLLSELPSGPIRARALLALSVMRSDDVSVMVALLEQARAEAGDHDRLRAQVEYWLGHASFGLAEFGAMRVHARAAVDAAERAGDPMLLAAALTAYAGAVFFAGHGIERDILRRAIALEESAPASTMYLPSGNGPAGAFALMLFWADDYVPGRPALEAVLALARDRGEELEAVAFLFELAILEWYAGNRDVAERHRAAAEQAIHGQDEAMLELWVAWGESLFAAGRGELEKARASAQRAIGMSERSNDMLLRSLPTIVLASVELWTGRPASAHTLLSPLRQSYLSSGLGWVGSLVLGLWSYDIEALLACGHIDEAHVVLDDLYHRAADCANPNATAIAARCRGLLLAARGEITAAIEALETALAEHALQATVARGRTHAAGEGVAGAPREAQDRGQGESRAGARDPRDGRSPAVRAARAR